jgi:hypothetical protein
MSGVASKQDAQVCDGAAAAAELIGYRFSLDNGEGP